MTTSTASVKVNKLPESGSRCKMSQMSSGFSWARRSDYVTSPVPPEEDGGAVRLTSSQFTSLSDQDRPHDSNNSDLPSAAFESPHEYSSYGSFEIPSRASTSVTMASSSNDSSFGASRFACSWPTCSLTFTRLSERDRHYITDHANNRERPYKCEIRGCQANVITWARAEKLRRHNKEWHGPYHCYFPNCARQFPCGFASSLDLEAHVENVHGGGYSGSPNQAAPTTYTRDELDRPAQTMDQGFSPAIVSPNYSSYSPFTGSEQPAAVSSLPRGNTTIHTRDPETWRDKTQPGKVLTRPMVDSLLSNCLEFKVQKSKNFQFGKVFKVIWSEPQGANGTDISEDESQAQKAMFRKIRRFVIVSTFPGHSLCLPILTYGGQGTLKHGVHADDHTVIYSSRKHGPTLLPGEVVRKRPLRMEPDQPSHNLHSASRVNYAKVYTVEHNVKVQFIGTLTRNAQAQIIMDYNMQHPPIKDSTTKPDYDAQEERTAQSWNQPLMSVQSYYINQTPHKGFDEQQQGYFAATQEPCHTTYSTQWNQTPAASSRLNFSDYEEPLQEQSASDQYGASELTSVTENPGFQTDCYD